MDRIVQLARIVLLAAVIICLIDVEAQIRRGREGRMGADIPQKMAGKDEREDKKQKVLLSGEKLVILIAFLNPDLYSEADGKEQQTIFFKSEIIRILEDEYQFKQVGEKSGEDQNKFLKTLPQKDICYVDTAILLSNKESASTQYETGIFCAKRGDTNSVIQRSARVYGRDSREYLSKFFKTLNVLLKEPKEKQDQQKRLVTARLTDAPFL